MSLNLKIQATQSSFFNFKQTMDQLNDRKGSIWTKQEDKALAYLKQQQKIQNWPEIAQKLSTQFGIHHRISHQCKNRYLNYLKNPVQIKKWSLQNYNKLIQLYLQHGNKWSQIANHFENINGLLIKNKFYSRLRKGFRNLNYLIKTYYSDIWLPFSFDLIFKLVNCADNKFDVSEKSLIGKKIQKQINFVEDIIKSIFLISWVNKKDLKTYIKYETSMQFNKFTFQNLISKINFIDENEGIKHSNRVLRNEQLPQQNSQLSANQIRQKPNIFITQALQDHSKSQQKILLQENQNNDNHIEIICINSFEHKPALCCLSQISDCFTMKPKATQNIINQQHNPKQYPKKHCSYRQKTFVSKQKEESVKIKHFID